MFLLKKPLAHFCTGQETRDIYLYNFPSYFGSHFRGHDILKTTQDKSGEAGNHKDHIQTGRIKVGKLSVLLILVLRVSQNISLLF